MFLGRVVGPGDPEWLADDREKALAYEMAQRQACQKCGTRREQFFDDDGAFHDPPQLEAVATHCEGCGQRDLLLLEIHAEAARSGGDASTAGRAVAGMSVVLEPFNPNRFEEDDDDWN